jgi:hypothetical protein
MPGSTASRAAVVASVDRAGTRLSTRSARAIDSTDHSPAFFFKPVYRARSNQADLAGAIDPSLRE